MTVVAVVATALIFVAALLALVRLERGPSMLDRTVAFDVLTTTIVGAVAVEAAVSRRTESIPILVVLSLVGFIGSVTIARFAARESEGEGRIRTAAEVATEERAREARAARDAGEVGGLVQDRQFKPPTLHQTTDLTSHGEPTTDGRGDA